VSQVQLFPFTFLSKFAGSVLWTRLLNATKELARQTSALQELTQAQQDETPAWKKAVDDFEISQSAVNPYQQPQSGTPQISFYHHLD
jgi:hypothetical protein